ncbi:hypothetical protein DFH08DRAFT_966691 [Mycena albidolilacea]|uniref:Uncharacterized protein n=1 Tax=Mycena albidolilacea TaxID=1033008 RepID=A0AAD7EJC7_9AGAR|nr:hypothetical protein DFH08DRAFT_966691 [Mycena albidolilacea]
MTAAGQSGRGALGPLIREYHSISLSTRGLKIDREGPSTLAACTLVASNLGEQSQWIIILLESVTLAGHRHAVKWALLQELPHIATYVIELRLEIPIEDDLRSPDSSATKFKDFNATDTRSILAFLTSVYLCLFTGVHNGGYYIFWCNIPTDLAAAYSEFFSRQHSLCELTIQYIMALLPDVVLSLLGAGPLVDSDIQ